MKEMDIGIVSNVVYPFVKGGAEKRIYEISTRLADQGNNITIYSRHWWDGPQRINHEGVMLQAVAPEQKLYIGDRRSITEAVFFGAEIINPIRKYGDSHDIIVVSMFPYFPVFGVALGNIFNDTPIATTWLEVWDDYWYEYLGKVGVAGKIVERLAARIPQHPIAISSTVATDLKSLGFDAANIDIIPGGINTSHISSVEPVEEGFDILFVGRLVEHKNVNIILDAFDTIANEANISLGVIGEGPQYDVLRSHASSLQHGDKITFLGFLEDYDEVLAHMRAADLFISPSTREGFGITLAEAMAAGCLVITVDHPDSAGSEVVGEGGFVTEPTTEAVIKAIRRYLDGERPKRDPIEAAGEYDWDVVAQRAKATYERIIQSK